MGRKLPPLNALKSFEAAARLSSFSAAAKELFVTHGAISQQVKLLEDYFQQPLFIRSNGKVYLCDAGKELLVTTTSALERIEKSSAKLVKNRDTATLTINLTATFASQWLIPRLVDFERQYPNIILRLSPSNYFSGNFDDQADIAIRWGGAKFSNLDMERLFYVDTFCACAPSLVNRSDGLNAPEDLARFTLIHDDQGDAWSAMLRQLGQDPLDQKNGLYYADAGLALQVAVEGRGVIAAGSILASQNLALGRLVLPFDHIIRRRNSYNIYYADSSRELPKVKVFRDWIFAQAREYQKENIDYSKFLSCKTKK